jgi:hypothetical protein
MRVCWIALRLRYPRDVVEDNQPNALDDLLKPLLAMGIDEAYARRQLASAEDVSERVAEVASLAAESDACVWLTQDMSLPVALFTLVDGLRQAGLSASTSRSVQGEPMLVFEGGRTAAYEIKFEPQAGVRDVVRTVAYILPRTHQLLIASDHEREGRLPVIVLNRPTYVALASVIGEAGLDRVFARAGSEPGAAKLQLFDGALPRPDLQERFRSHAPQLSAARELESAADSVKGYEPRIPWPADRSQPPGEDFAQLCQALAAAPLAHALAGDSDSELAQLIYRFALVTTAGAQCDLHAARRNPGRHAQAVLGGGQLIWAYFIFAALGADADAERAAKLLSIPWVRDQERGPQPSRRRAFYDLVALLRSEARGTYLLRLAELLPLRLREGWTSESAVAAATAVHSEPLNDVEEQLTHHPLFYAWPAELYALAREAGAIDLLPKDNPFLARPLALSHVDLGDPLIARLHEQLRAFDALGPAQLLPVLDPLPVIVDVEITRVEGDDVFGHTLLTDNDEAEHKVVAPRAGREMAPGEIWLLEVQDARRETLEQHFDDLGATRCAITVPTGEWLEKVTA